MPKPWVSKLKLLMASARLLLSKIVVTLLPSSRVILMWIEARPEPASVMLQPKPLVWPSVSVPEDPVMLMTGLVVSSSVTVTVRVAVEVLQRDFFVFELGEDGLRR